MFKLCQISGEDVAQALQEKEEEMQEGILCGKKFRNFYVVRNCISFVNLSLLIN